jgi:hypothetical protein
VLYLNALEAMGLLVGVRRIVRRWISWISVMNGRCPGEGLIPKKQQSGARRLCDFFSAGGIASIRVGASQCPPKTRSRIGSKAVPEPAVDVEAKRVVLQGADGSWIERHRMLEQRLEEAFAEFQHAGQATCWPSSSTSQALKVSTGAAFIVFGPSSVGTPRIMWQLARASICLRKAAISLPPQSISSCRRNPRTEWPISMLR